MLSIAVCSMLHDMVLVGSKWNGGKDTHKIGERCTCSVGSFDNSGLSVGSQQDDIIKLIFFNISHGIGQKSQGRLKIHICDDGIKCWFNEEEDKWGCEEDLQIS